MRCVMAVLQCRSTGWCETRRRLGLAVVGSEQLAGQSKGFGVRGVAAAVSMSEARSL